LAGRTRFGKRAREIRIEFAIDFDEPGYEFWGHSVSSEQSTVNSQQ
jgi:hypothetical protein